jgi:hypothetical protein
MTVHCDNGTELYKKILYQETEQDGGADSSTCRPGNAAFVCPIGAERWRKRMRFTMRES